MCFSLGDLCEDSTSCKFSGERARYCSCLALSQALSVQLQFWLQPVYLVCADSSLSKLKALCPPCVSKQVGEDLSGVGWCVRVLKSCEQLRSFVTLDLSTRRLPAAFIRLLQLRFRGNHSAQLIPEGKASRPRDDAVFLPLGHWSRTGAGWCTRL